MQRFSLHLRLRRLSCVLMAFSFKLNTYLRSCIFCLENIAYTPRSLLKCFQCVLQLLSIFAVDTRVNGSIKNSKTRSNTLLSTTFFFFFNQGGKAFLCFLWSNMEEECFQLFFQFTVLLYPSGLLAIDLHLGYCVCCFMNNASFIHELSQHLYCQTAQLREKCSGWSTLGANLLMHLLQCTSQQREKKVQGESYTMLLICPHSPYPSFSEVGLFDQ